MHQFPLMAFKNRPRLQFSKQAGCYHCGNIFAVSEIKEYTDNDQTCLCPHCRVDAVIGESPEFELTTETLEKAKIYWFKNSK